MCDAFRYLFCCTCTLCITSNTRQMLRASRGEPENAVANLQIFFCARPRVRREFNQYTFQLYFNSSPISRYSDESPLCEQIAFVSSPIFIRKFL